MIDVHTWTLPHFSCHVEPAKGWHNTNKIFPEYRLTNFPMRNFLSECDVTDKKENVGCWTPNQWKEGETPTNKNVLETYAFVCDFDKMSRDEAKEIFQTLRGYAYIAHATFSHKPDAPSFRVILPVSRPIKPEEFKRIWWEVHEIFPLLDKACKDPRRLWLLPSVHQDHQDWYWCKGQNGEVLIDVDALLLASMERKPPTPPAPPPKFSSEKTAMNYAINKDPSVRLQIAEQLGATVMERGVAMGVLCPHCHRNSVWFTINPTDGGWARCNHSNKCGWYGQLTQYMEQ